MTHITRQSAALSFMTRPLSVAILLLPLGCQVEAEGRAEENANHGPAFVAEAETLLEQLTPSTDGWRTTPVLESEIAFRRVGIRFDASSVVDIEARFSDDGVNYSDWLAVTLTYQDQIVHNAHVDAPFPASSTEVRFRSPMEAQLAFVAVDLIEYFENAEPGGQGVVDVEAAGQAEQGLAADGIVVSRSQWGARQRNCGSPHAPDKLTIHHTVTPNNDSVSVAARVRQIQAYHIDSRGWCDVGYHFLVGQDGQVYQGRYENKTGAHAGGANANNVGIAYVGTFDGMAPSTLMMEAGARIINALVNTYGISRDRSAIFGHREIGTTSTTCPGSQFFARLDDLIALSSVVDGNAPPPPEGNDTPPPSEPAPGCYSSTLGNSVEHDSCVQVTYAGCGLGECAWFHCNAGNWQCINRDSCGDDVAIANDECAPPAPPAPVLEASCYSATVGQDVADESCVQVTYAGCGQDGCGWYRCDDGSWQCTVRDDCDDDLAYANADCSAGEEPPVEEEPVAQSYADLPSTHAAFAAAEALREAGALWGCAAGQFCPEQLITRAEVAYLFAQLWDGSINFPIGPIYNDVTTDMWVFDAVQEMTTREITYGCGSGNFCPWQPVSRAAAAIFFRRAEGVSNGAPANPSYVDVSPDHWAFGAIEAMSSAGFVSGCSTTPVRYCPDDMLTRADAAIMFASAYLP